MIFVDGNELVAGEFGLPLWVLPDSLKHLCPQVQPIQPSAVGSYPQVLLTIFKCLLHKVGTDRRRISGVMHEPLKRTGRRVEAV